jgi:hypothetical protein
MAKGLLGLPALLRLWQRGILHEKDGLASGYTFLDTRDTTVLMKAGISPDAFARHIAGFPTFQQTEVWVEANASTLSAWPAIDEAVAQRENLDDLDTFHACVAGACPPAIGHISPAVSPLLTGALDLCHLPRLWTKAMIDAIGLLPEGYNSGKGPLDEHLASAIGIELAGAIRFIRAERPMYRAFEEWIADLAATLEPSVRETWNNRIINGEKPEYIAGPERELLGIGNSNERGGVLLNHLVDMHYFYQEFDRAR